MKSLHGGGVDFPEFNSMQKSFILETSLSPGKNPPQKKTPGFGVFCLLSVSLVTIARKRGFVYPDLLPKVSPECSFQIGSLGREGFVVVSF